MISNTAFGAVNALSGHVGQTGTGTYLLTNYTERTGYSGQTRIQLTLADMTGRATGFVWPEARNMIACPATPSPVSINGTIQFFEGQPQFKVHGMAALSSSEVQHAAALLSQHQCPAVAVPALARLVHLERELPWPLDGFLREVLLDPLIGVPFLRCRASVRHHHAYVGGLLVHSTENLDLAYENTRRIIPYDEWSPYLAQLAYLLHDVGKLKSVGETRRPMHALVVRHEFMSIELLAPHLRWLEQRNPALATALRYTLSYLATPSRARSTPNHVAAEVVETLDQWSAAGHNQRDLSHLLKGYMPPHRRQNESSTVSPSIQAEPLKPNINQPLSAPSIH